MSIEIKVEKENGLLGALARQLGVNIEKDGMLRIPEEYGRGYLRGFKLSGGLSMMVSNCELLNDMVINRTNSNSFKERIILTINNIFSFKNEESPVFDRSKIPSVQIFSGNIDSKIFMPRKTVMQSINIGIEVGYLKDLVDKESQNLILKSMRQDNRSFLFEELVSPSIQKVADEINQTQIPESLQSFYFRVKAEELVCLLFLELLKRENLNVSSLNADDANTIYKIRDRILSKLDEPPVISDLASMAGFSESKLKRLFKQIFGDSIFSYYQNFRMLEAARLLKTQKVTVSEVGYRMGFSNLSHFSKIFEAHTGMKPKKYSLK